jgi:hypothetical protein
MDQSLQVFSDYALAFEETYIDDNWSRLRKYFSDAASYEVRGGPLACEIHGVDAILTGLKKSVDGLDRRCDDRKLELTGTPTKQANDQGEEWAVEWYVSYRRGDSPRGGFAGRSVFRAVDGVIVMLRDEYTDDEMGKFAPWAMQYAADLDGSYI